MLFISSTGEFFENVRLTTLGVLPSVSKEVRFLDVQQLGLFFEALLEEATFDKEVYDHSFPEKLAYVDTVSRVYVTKIVEELSYYWQALTEQKIPDDQGKMLDALMTLDSILKVLNCEDLFRRKANNVHHVFVVSVKNWIDRAAEGEFQHAPLLLLELLFIL